MLSEISWTQKVKGRMLFSHMQKLEQNEENGEKPMKMEGISVEEKKRIYGERRGTGRGATM